MPNCQLKSSSAIMLMKSFFLMLVSSCQVDEIIYEATIIFKILEFDPVVPRVKPVYSYVSTQKKLLQNNNKSQKLII
jgi:hypothetical protein